MASDAISDPARSNPALSDYDPSGIGQLNGNFCGLPFDYDSAKLIIIGVPWEVTVSYGGGTALGPQQVLDASPQLDLYDFDHPDGWQQGIFMPEIDRSILQQSESYKAQAAQIIDRLEQGRSLTELPDLSDALNNINRACESMNRWLFEQCTTAIAQGKRVAVVGGDHSSPLGYFQAQAAHHDNFGILHIDAHADLRDAYEGFKYSHASIMFNALAIPQVSKLVQVGLRDICIDEVNLINDANPRVIAFYDRDIKQQLYTGQTWQTLCQDMIQNLPQKVHISYDVDGLDPKLCPATGTPVPGGLELEQTFYLFSELIRSGREIIGFDLCEVGNAEWDGNVGARIVYKLANLMDLSRSDST
ncbi:agmatinase family protein [filamentous cyanobacterium LEGE 11480]|uniref:Agmatinase family protein n=1 Tax=Romeriopsis navalis LEGE 11480 TaxID=2777977 RepID=A0A928VKP2_9CYAN|nr:agmatinase family protein [Romeriopsis navalis]MBE9030105.1 agmatinase family protein [Romeriopsis navalis LEGE 11480]